MATRRRLDHRLRELLKRNNLVIVEGSKHPHIRTKDGHYVASIAGTPSDKRGTANAISQLRAKGYTK